MSSFSFKRGDTVTAKDPTYFGVGLPGKIIARRVIPISDDMRVIAYAVLSDVDPLIKDRQDPDRCKIFLEEELKPYVS